MYLIFALPLLSFLALPIGWLGFELFSGLAMIAVAFGLWMAAAPPILRADTRLNTWPEQLVTTGRRVRALDLTGKGRSLLQALPYVGG